ncbi:hypothetical protein H4582DRAFT_2061035 [Lactarius indigo]|nr:hypothetical protein H4582DRAFT_2061035 [Lactarius indigo]
MSVATYPTGSARNLGQLFDVPDIATHVREAAYFDTGGDRKGRALNHVHSLAFTSFPGLRPSIDVLLTDLATLQRLMLSVLSDLALDACVFNALTQNTLTELTLHSNTPVGTSSGLSLARLHFPLLYALSLCGLVFQQSIGVYPFFLRHAATLASRASRPSNLRARNTEKLANFAVPSAASEQAPARNGKTKEQLYLPAEEDGRGREVEDKRSWGVCVGLCSKRSEAPVGLLRQQSEVRDSGEFKQVYELLNTCHSYCTMQGCLVAITKKERPLDGDSHPYLQIKRSSRRVCGDRIGEICMQGIFPKEKRKMSTREFSSRITILPTWVPNAPPKERRQRVMPAPVEIGSIVPAAMNLRPPLQPQLTERPAGGAFEAPARLTIAN